MKNLLNFREHSNNRSEVSKTSKYLKIIYLVLLVLPVMAFFVSCEDEELTDDNTEETTKDLNFKKGKSNKIDICHYSEDDGSWKLLSVNENSWDAHVNHGDVRLDDQDGDGFVPDNECNYGQQGDCDDNDTSINPEAEEICGNEIDEDCDGSLVNNCCSVLTEDIFELFDFQFYYDIRGGSDIRTTGISESGNSSIEINAHIEGQLAGRTFIIVVKNGQQIYSGELNSPEPCRSIILDKAVELNLPCYFNNGCDGS